jgi:hypothetical protein
VSATAFTGSPFAPISGGGGSDPFEGAQFGFEVPQGDPGEIRTAGAQAGALATALTFRAQDVTRAASEATAGWSGQAQGAFADLSSQTVGSLNANSDAFTRAANAMTTLAGQLEHAQQVTREAARQCSTYQTQMSADQNNASATAKTTQAKSLAAAAVRAAGAAQGELDSWRRRGQSAATTYQEQAQQAANEISDAAGQLQPLHSPAGAPAPPVPVSAGDTKIAQSVFDKVKNLTSKDLGNDPGRTIDQYAGRHLTPGQMAALYQMAEQEHRAGKGSLIDGVGGFVNFATGGLVHFGDSGTARYRGGEIAGMIPLTPGGLLEDGERGVLKLTDEEAEHLAEEDGARDFAKDPHGTQYGPDDPGPLKPHDAATFDGGSYQKVVTDQPTTLYRVYGGGARRLGGFWTRSEPTDLAQARRDLALNPAWGNTGDKVVEVTVPAGTTFYEGTAAAQPTAGGTLPGGGNQIFFKDDPPPASWVTP